MSLDGKVAFITGGASGIGRATAIAAARAGAKVMLVDLDVPGMEETAHQIDDEGRCALAKADVRVEDHVKAAVEKTIARFGQLDLAHNNAGIFDVPGPITSYPLDLFEETLRSNVVSVFLCLKAELPHMVGRKTGSIVNTSSASGLRATENVAGYTTSKHAVIGLTRAAALENARYGIRVNAICPGLVRSPMTLKIFGNEGWDEVVGGHPIGRFAETNEIADAVVWLFDDRSSFVVGSNLVIDGGFTIA